MNIENKRLLSVMKLSATSNTTALSIPPTEMDDFTLLQYALKLKEIQPELFSGTQGVLVVDRVANYHFENKKLQRGDIIIVYNGQPMNSVKHLINAIQANATKPQVELQFIRANAVQTVVLQGGEIGLQLANITGDILPKQSYELMYLQKEGHQACAKYDYHTALEKWEVGLKQARELNDKFYISQFVNDIGTVYQQLGQYQKALEYYEQVLAINIDVGQSYWIGAVFTDIGGTVLTNLGSVCRNIGQYQKALEYHEQALFIYREIDDKHGIEVNLSNIGNVYRDLGQYQKALEYYKQTLAILNKTDNRHIVGAVLTSIGVVYHDLVLHQKALEYQQKALTIYREIIDKHGIGNNFANIGNVYNDLGQYQKALESQDKALVIYREIGDKRGEGAVFTNIGNVYRNLGQYHKLLEYYEQALAIYRQIGDKHRKGVVLSNIGVMYSILNQHQIALTYFEQALAIHTQIGNKRSMGNNLTNIGIVYDEFGVMHDELGLYQKALEHFEQALAIYIEIEDKRGKSELITNIGNTYLNLKRYQNSLEHYEQALAIDREIGNKHAQGVDLTNIGVIYNYLGQYQKAYTAFQESTAILETLGAGEPWIALRGLSSVQVHLNQPEAAITHYKQALDNIETLRTGLEKEHKLSVMRDKLYVYDEFIDYLQSLHKEQPTKGHDRRALETFERKQGRIFLEEMGQSGARLFAGLPQEISQGELSLENQLANTRKDLVEERSKPVAGLEGEIIQNPELIKNLEQREQELQTEIEALQDKIKTQYPDYYALKYPEPVSLVTLQNDVLQPDELMLVYGVMENSTSLWMIGKETFQLFNLPVTEDMLTDNVKYIRRGLEKQLKTQPKIPTEKHGLKRIFKNPLNQKTLSDLTYEIYKLLVPESVHPLLNKTSTLYIVPTSSLYALPFEILVTKPVEQPTDIPHYLIEEAPIAYLSSASLLKTLRDAKKTRQQTAPYPLLAFANPVYDNSPRKGNESDISIAAMRSNAYYTLRGGHFDSLPETEDEAKEIAKLLNAPKDSNPLQLGDAASCNTIIQLKKQDKLDKYQYVLFATHGIIPGDLNYITQPALVLSHPDTEKTKDIENHEECNGGYLTMANIFDLKLNAKLVSLSACNTGSGEQERGEGVMGLTRAFMYAGTPAIAVTLWSVESFSAKTLNIGFFQHLKEIDKPAAALQAIKLQMLRGDKGDKYKHPYYWAPFVVFGEEPLKENNV
jgi:tetratricopeptide (TPR) repeat protein